MKAIMYHYVRPNLPGLPYFRHLHINDFVQQLEYLKSKHGFVSKNEFEDAIGSVTPAKGVILTFDDGLRDHYQYVLPELLKRGLWGIFYIPTGPITTGTLMDVHRIHLLIGKHGGRVIAEAIRGMVDETMMSHERVEEFHTLTYRTQRNTLNTAYVKRVLNYFIDYKHRTAVIDALVAMFSHADERESGRFYLSKGEIAEMHDAGMVIGSHTVNHFVMSKLTVEEQEEEIISSFRIIQNITGSTALKTFCYPYGGFHTFTSATELLLQKHDCLFSFNVEPRDISDADLSSRPQALPRFDCNALPYGACRPLRDGRLSIRSRVRMSK